MNSVPTTPLEARARRLLNDINLGFCLEDPAHEAEVAMVLAFARAEIEEAAKIVEHDPHLQTAHDKDRRYIAAAIRARKE